MLVFKIIFCYYIYDEKNTKNGRDIKTTDEEYNKERPHLASSGRIESEMGKWGKGQGTKWYSLKSFKLF